MNNIKTKEEVVNNSNQPLIEKSKMEILRSKHPKGKTMDDIQWLHFYLNLLYLNFRVYFRYY